VEGLEEQIRILDYIVDKQQIELEFKFAILNIGNPSSRSGQGDTAV
jgi:hypothetical protein